MKDWLVPNQNEDLEVRHMIFDNQLFSSVEKQLGKYKYNVFQNIADYED